MYKILSWAAVILWMAFIFFLSHQPATESNELSTGVTKMIVDQIEKMAPHAEFDLSNFNHIVRKNAHFFAYFLLGILLLNALRRSGVQGSKGIILALLISVLYATSDEVHQLFIPGRGPGVRDVLIDSAGASVGVLLYLGIGKFTRKNFLNSSVKR